MVFIGQWNRKQDLHSARSSAIAAFSARLGLVCVALSISTLKYVRSATRGQRRTRWPLDVQVKGDQSDRETRRVLKMKWAKRKDAETGKNVNDVTKLIYNKRVTIAGIPAEADEYMLGSRSAVAWLIDRYQVKKDKASGIVNDPNDWADEVGNPRYIADLIGKVTRVAMETVRIVDGLVEEGSAAES